MPYELAWPTFGRVLSVWCHSTRAIMRHTCTCLYLVVTISGVMGSVALADEGDPESVPRLVEQLAADDFEEREHAAARLLEMGERVRPALELARNRATDLEVRARLDRLLEELRLLRMQADEMHVMAVRSVHCEFRVLSELHEYIDWTSLCKRLALSKEDPRPSPTRRLYELLPDDIQAVIADRESVRRIHAWQDALHKVNHGHAPSLLDQHRKDSSLHSKVCRSIQAILESTNYYCPESHDAMELDAEALALRENHAELTLLEQWVLNRRIFEATFPDAVEKSSFSLESATVCVHVGITDRPVNVVLSSYSSVRWKVIPSPRAQIRNVIVSGYYPQDVTGTNAPVHFLVYKGGRGNDLRFFCPRSRTDIDYLRMENVLQAMTRMDVTTFQVDSLTDQGLSFWLKQDK
jgi:hypothetical protein